MRVTIGRPRRRRLELADSPLAQALFCDLYCALGHPRRLVCYCGGALTAKEYEQRRSGEPDEIVRQWWCEGSITIAQQACLLVLPVPDVSPRPRFQLRDDLRVTFRQLIVPAICRGTALEAVGFVGYSIGAYIAVHLAAAMPQCRAVATMGGVAAAEALAEAGPQRREVSFATFLNGDDSCADDTDRLERALAGRGTPFARHRSCPGGHDLDDYIANGSLRQAFEFVVRRMLR